MEKIKSSKIFKMFLVFVMAVLLFTMVPANVYATNTDGDLYIDGHKILTIYYGEGNGSRAYFDPDPFTFKGSANGSTKYYDGEYMALEVSATSPAGAIPVYIDLYVYNTHVHNHCTIWANGQTGKFDWISLGNTGGSSADCYYYVDTQYANVNVTVDVKTYSWI